MTSFNAALNAFIDSLTFDDIPEACKTDAVLAAPPGRDRINTAVQLLMNEWEMIWGGDASNTNKMELLWEVAEKRAYIEANKTENGITDATNIERLLSDMVPGFKDGAYSKALEERNLFVVTKMAGFLNKLDKLIPPAIQQYFQDRLNMPH